MAELTGLGAKLSPESRSRPGPVQLPSAESSEW